MLIFFLQFYRSSEEEKNNKKTLSFFLHHQIGFKYFKTGRKTAQLNENSTYLKNSENNATKEIDSQPETKNNVDNTKGHEITPTNCPTIDNKSHTAENPSLQRPNHQNHDGHNIQGSTNKKASHEAQSFKNQEYLNLIALYVSNIKNIYTEEHFFIIIAALANFVLYENDENEKTSDLLDTLIAQIEKYAFVCINDEFSISQSEEIEQKLENDKEKSKIEILSENTQNVEYNLNKTNSDAQSAQNRCTYSRKIVFSRKLASSLKNFFIHMKTIAPVRINLEILQILYFIYPNVIKIQQISKMMQHLCVFMENHPLTAPLKVVTGIVSSFIYEMAKDEPDITRFKQNFDKVGVNTLPIDDEIIQIFFSYIETYPLAEEFFKHMQLLYLDENTLINQTKYSEMIQKILIYIYIHRITFADIETMHKFKNQMADNLPRHKEANFESTYEKFLIEYPNYKKASSFYIEIMKSMYETRQNNWYRCSKAIKDHFDSNYTKHQLDMNIFSDFFTHICHCNHIQANSKLIKKLLLYMKRIAPTEADSNIMLYFSIYLNTICISPKFFTTKLRILEYLKKFINARADAEYIRYHNIFASIDDILSLLDGEYAAKSYKSSSNSKETISPSVENKIKYMHSKDSEENMLLHLEKYLESDSNLQKNDRTDENVKSNPKIEPPLPNKCVEENMPETYAQQRKKNFKYISYCPHGIT